MLGILDLLNSEDASEATMSQPPPPSATDPPSLEELSKLGLKLPSADPLTLKFRVLKLLPRLKIHPSLLRAKKLVDIALRHKLGSKRGSHLSELGSKLHLKLLEAGLRVRLILNPLIYELFKQLTPHTTGRNTLSHVAFDNDRQILASRDISSELKDDYFGRGRKSSSRGYQRSSNSLTPNNYEALIGSSSNLSVASTPLQSLNELLEPPGFNPNERSDLTSSTGLIYSGLEFKKDGIKTEKTDNESESSGDSPGYNGYSDFSNSSDLTHLFGKQTCLKKPISKHVRLIDNNLVNLAGVSSKVLKSFQVDKEQRQAQQDFDDSRPGMVTTFNNLDTAVTSLFGSKTYSLVRVTRSSSNAPDGSVLLKLECAQPGDTRLLDDREFLEDMAASLGKEGQTPNNLFIKKVVARPRYKSDMKIYIIPTSKKILLYSDKRLFERDLINGVIEMDCPTDRYIYTTFPAGEVILEVREMLHKSLDLNDADCSELVPNHMTNSYLSTSNLQKWNRGGNGLGLSLPSSLSLPSLMSNTALSGSVSLDPSGETTPSDRAKLTLLSIPNAKMELIEEPGDLKFDTSYMA